MNSTHRHVAARLLLLCKRTASTPDELEVENQAPCNTKNDHSMGWFKILPIELLHFIFDLLELRSLSHISMTSRNMSTAALTYLQSARGLNYVMPIVSTCRHRTIVDPRGVGKQHNNYVTCCCNYSYNYSRILFS